MSRDLYLTEYFKRKQKRQAARRNFDRLRSPEFHKQNEVLDSRSTRFKAIQCTRRAGKSVGEAIDHMEICEKYPGSRNLYMGLTLDSVSEIIWDVFKDLAEKGGYDCVFNETKKLIKFKNGSRIRLFGLDVSEKHMRKVLGQKFRKVTIDEAGSITQDMKRICYQVIMPALTDLAPLSWLTLCGTPENIPNTFFEAVTSGKEKGRAWKVFKWTAYDNPHMQKQWAAEIEEIIRDNPLVVEASWYRTHYLNEWCADEELLIIKMDSERNHIDELPKSVDWMYVLGCDLGYNDATAFSVLAFSYSRRECYIIKSFKATSMDFTDVAKAIKKLQSEYPFYKIIIDGANKQGVEEIRERHKIPLECAEKSDKATYLRLLRDDLIQGYFKMIVGENNELVTEWSSLMWKDENREKEDDRCQNHLSDATLYGWRFCRHHFFQPPEKEDDRDSDEYMAKLETKEADQMRQEEEEGEWWGTLKTKCQQNHRLEKQRKKTLFYNAMKLPSSCMKQENQIQSSLRRLGQRKLSGMISEQSSQRSLPKSA